MYCLIVFRTMTQAQRVASILNSKSISVSLTKPPLEAGKGSCSTALKLPAHQLDFAAKLISKLSFAPIGYYQIVENGVLREVFP